jgi:formate-dependent nitrite reductase membrane component NrfD
MRSDSIQATNAPGYASGPITKAPDWHGLVAWDLLFNNLTTGLFMVAAIGDLAAPEVFGPLARVAYPIAFVLLVTDLMCLVLDLGDPLRFHHMLRVFKPSSPMSLGTWCLTVYSLPLTVAAALSLLPEGGIALEWVRKAAVALGLLPALGSALYKGVLLSTNAQPGWRDARWLGGYLTNSALLLG